MKKLPIIFLLLVFAVSSVFSGGQQEADQQEIVLKALFMAQASYSEQNVRDMTNEFMEENPGVKVEVEFVPYEDLRNKTLLAYGSKDAYDVTLTDDIWFTEFVTKDMIHDISSDVPDKYKDGVLEGAWNVTKKNGKYYGIPWILDTMYLFYNTEMLSEAGYSGPPESLGEMLEMAETMKAEGIVDYPIVLSLGQAECLICVYSNVLEAVDGKFQDSQGNYILDTSGGVEALDYLLKLQDAEVLNPSSVEYFEEDVRRVFSAGDAAFALNWTYMYNLAKDPNESSVSDSVGISVFPGKEGVKDNAAMSGSMGLSISKKTDNYDEALAYILHLTSQEIQNKYSELQLPIWESSYDDPAVKQGQEEVVAAAKQALSILNTRPSDPNYQEISSTLQEYIQKALYGDLSSEMALKSAIEDIEKIK